MSRHPVVLTTLEEDFKKLGLLAEEGPEKPAPSGEPASNKASKSRNVGSMTDDPSNDGDDKHDEPKGIPHQGAPKAKTNPAGPEPKPMKAEGKEDDSEDEEDSDESDDDKSDKEESFAPRGASAVLEKVNSLRGARTQTESNNAFSRAESLIEGVTQIMGEIAESRRAESVKAFANVSVIAEMLSTGFGGFADKYSDTELAEASEALGVLAGEAAEIAQVLESEDDVDGDLVEGEFRKQMDALISSLDLYSDVVEADENLDEDSESDEVEEEAEAIAEEEDEDDSDDDESDDDDDSDDEKDDKKAPPFAKKKEEAYMPYGKGKGPMVSKPGKGAKPAPAKESK